MQAVSTKLVCTIGTFVSVTENSVYIFLCSEELEIILGFNISPGATEKCCFIYAIYQVVLNCDFFPPLLKKGGRFLGF